MRVAIVGAGVGGLCAAIRLAAQGCAVEVLERQPNPGGKMREIVAGGLAVDSGPTVLTMRPVFDELFEAAGASLDAEVGLRRLDTLARHAWSGGAGLDLTGDAARNADAIGDFAGAAEARGYLAFAERARRIYEVLESTYIRASRPNVASLMMRVGPRRLGQLSGISPFATLWSALGEHFADPRLCQLFGRYATYCGSSPFLAPATLMLVAHVEREGVWVVEGGMYRLAEALAKLAERQGVVFRYGAEAARIRIGPRGADGVVLRDGEVVEADAVVAAFDVAAFGAGLLGPEATRAAPAVTPAERSLSALTWSLAAEVEGFPLLRHTVFFSDDYAAEFADIRAGRPPADPTVYVCAQDRGEDRDGRARDVPEDRPGSTGPERLFCIVNAPADGDRDTDRPREMASCETRTFRRLERCGLHVRRRPACTVATSPSDFARLFPATGGALYGRASHGWTASFRRPGSRSRIARLYLAGGSTHPGPGVPMAAISGMLAASSVISDRASTRTWRPAATPGGTSTR